MLELVHLVGVSQLQQWQYVDLWVGVASGGDSYYGS
jgi:hypothetical protein